MTKIPRELQVSAAEAASSDARYRATFHQAALGIVHTAPDGTLIEANPAFCSMLGYSRREMLRRRLPDLLAAHVQGALGGDGGRGGSDPRLLARKKVHSRTEQYRHRNGSIVWAHRTGSVASDAEGRPYLI